VSGHYTSLNQVLANCPVGALVGAVIEAPTCWDGKNLDSPNHRDHMAYESYGTWGYKRCPLDHPYVIPAFTLGAWFPASPEMSLSSDAMFPNLPKGSTFHADYWEAWQAEIKAMWTDYCLNQMRNCSGGDLGNGYTLNGAAL
jgi:hypothetical protein